VRRVASPGLEERSKGLSGALKALMRLYGLGEGSKAAGLMRKREPTSLVREKPKGEVVEPLMTRRRLQTASLNRNGAGHLRGMSGRHVVTAQHGTGETLPGGPRRVKAVTIS